MFIHRFDQNVSKRVVFHWFLMSFNGGCINAGAYLATGRFVSHVTGFATLFGVTLTNKEIQTALGFLSVPLFFLLGSFVAGCLIDRPVYHGRKPHFDWVMGLCATCLFLASQGDRIFTVSFGGTFFLKENYALLALLCLASGLQNAAITSSSGRSVRTTHLTGLTTDLGLGLAKTFGLDQKKEISRAEWRLNYLRAGSIFSFVLGSVVGAWFFIQLGYSGFLLPFAIAAYAAWHGRMANKLYSTASDLTPS